MEIKQPWPLGERVGPVNCVQQEVTETGSCFTHCCRGASKARQKGGKGYACCDYWLCTLPCCLTWISVREEKCLTEPLECRTDYIKMLSVALLYGRCTNRFESFAYSD